MSQFRSWIALASDTFAFEIESAIRHPDERFSHHIHELPCSSKLMWKGLVLMGFLLHTVAQVDLKLFDCLGRSSHSGQGLKHLSCPSVEENVQGREHSYSNLRCGSKDGR